MSSGSSPSTTAAVLASASPAEAARALRHMRARRLVMGLVSWVVLPTLCAAVYFGALASEQYESVASFALRGPDGAVDAAMLRDLVASRAALQELNKGGELRAHYLEGGDALSRLSPAAGTEALFKYYQGKVDTSYDTHAGVLTLRVRAFSGAAAKKIAERLLQVCGESLERVGHSGVDARIAAEATTVAGAKAELLRVQRQIAELELTAGSGAAPTQRAELETARFEKTLAERFYESARTSLEHARADRSKQTLMVSVAEPSMPDLASYPRRGYSILTVFFASLALFGIGRLLIAAVREHGQF